MEKFKPCEFWKKFEGTENIMSGAMNTDVNILPIPEGQLKKWKRIVQQKCAKDLRYNDNYLCDRDSKIEKGNDGSKPYENLVVKKRECIGHVQQLMCTQLQKKKKKKRHSLKKVSQTYL